MSYDGPTDCVGEDCLDSLVLPDFECSDGTINQAWLDKLNTNFRLLAESLCCVSEEGGFVPFDTPVEILSENRLRSAGTWTSGLVDFDLNTLAGVTVPSGAVGAVIRVGTGVNGQDDPPDEPADLFAYGQIEIAKTTALLNGGNFFNTGAVPTLAAYVDTNLEHSDNDMTNDAHVALNGNNFAYVAKARFDNTDGTDTVFLRLFLVGFI